MKVAISRKMENTFAGKFNAKFQRAACGFDEAAERPKIQVGLTLILYTESCFTHALGDLLVSLPPGSDCTDPG